MNTETKIKGRKEISLISCELRKKGKSIVTTNGVFDILHVGHVKSLEEAKGQGDVLIVGINSDNSVKMNKGPERPINKELERARVVAALGCVDYAVIFDEKTPIQLLEEIKPDVHVKGSDYGENCIEAETVRKHGGRIHIAKLVEGYSSSRIIEGIGKGV